MEQEKLLILAFATIVLIAVVYCFNRALKSEKNFTFEAMFGKWVKFVFNIGKR